MKRSTNGFTMIELVFVILIGSILTGVALSSFQNVQARFAVRGAKEVYMTWHQRARAKAIESGETIIMVVWVDGDSTALMSWVGGAFQFSDVQRFNDELGVQLRTQANNTFIMCMTPRGYADRNCGQLGSLLGTQQTYGDTIRLQFWLNADSASVLILPMGQLVG